VSAAARIRWTGGDEHDRFLVGETWQVEAFAMQTNRDGEVYGFQTVVRAHCSDGQVSQVVWSPNANPTMFRRNGERLAVRERWTRRHDTGLLERGWARLEGRVGGDGGSARGTLDAETTFTHRGRVYARCGARHIASSAGEGQSG
jgi:hypothetical protein